MEKHGGNITAFAQEVECKVDEVIDLSSNINFVKPTIDIDFNSLDISAYPNYKRLYQNIATRYDISSSNIELFNGATVAIHTLFRELKLEYCTLYAPLYSEYLNSAKTYGYKIELINRFEDIEQDIKENSLVIFVNPSTPDGKFYNIDRLIQRWIEKKCTILIDESFLDFTPYESSVKYLNRYSRLYILKSMTKFYSSAGMRIGAIFSNEKSIKNLKVKEPLWKISEFDSQYIQSVLRDNSFIAKSNKINREAKEYLMTILKESILVERIYDSTSNFILVKLKDITAEEFQLKVANSKIMVRDCSNFHFLDNNFVRVAVKEVEKLQIFKGHL